MHLGISYWWSEAGEGVRTGHLCIVKNWLPPAYKAQPMQPLLPEVEIKG